MSDPRSTAMACDTTALGHLERVIEAHFPRQSRHDGDAVSARCKAFTAAAFDLAQRYMQLRLQAQDAENRRRRFEAIAQAAQQLRFAMEGLNLSDLRVLESAQRATRQAYVDDLDDPQGYNLDKQHEIFDEPWGPRPASRMLQWQDLRWLEQGARRLCVPRRRGRPENTAERWAARQFVFLCHKHGWSPVRVAHSGSEKQQADPQPSGAIMCLAAILVAGGENEARAKSAALSAMKPLRGKFTHLEWPAECVNHPDYEPEPNEYTVNLHGMTWEWSSSFERLPQFGPKNE
ncbi:hypothetical protein [Laribacter hongkongensis]|uniref:hypothetical protein n=2 Tax=Laribacter hongkongensis TaxID=168471 RepID=UPI001EFE112D|nr:hypothetical protein [Laribacter hongkongensis]